MAVATSSRRRNFEKKSKHLQAVFELFEEKVVCGDDQQYNMRGKPAPDIFLVAAKEVLGRDVGDLNVEPTIVQLEERAKGLVFEDALPGLQAGKRAGMSGRSPSELSKFQHMNSILPVVWVPDPNLLKFGHGVDEKADLLLHSLEEFKPHEWGLPSYPISIHSI
jgi:pseudouridine-5'-monophosphatase